MYETLKDSEITQVNLVAVQVRSWWFTGESIELDPYYDAVDWHEAARGDGTSYSGVVERIQRNPGESLNDLLTRAKARAHELSEE